jgi:hypothetical protein
MAFTGFLSVGIAPEVGLRLGTFFFPARTLFILPDICPQACLTRRLLRSADEAWRSSSTSLSLALGPSVVTFGRVSGHPLAQNELALHMFLQEPSINKNYTPGKVRAK